jgi:hypothetical protein
MIMFVFGFASESLLVRPHSSEQSTQRMLLFARAASTMGGQP